MKTKCQKHSSIKEQVDKLEFKIKVLALKRHYRGDEKISHRLEENLCKAVI